MPTPVVTPSTTDPAQVLRELVTARVLNREQAQKIEWDFQTTGLRHDAMSFAEFLVDAGLLTRYQAERSLTSESNRLVIGPYLIQEPIGSGSLGMVYRAIHRENRQRYAVKLLPLRSMWNVRQAKRQVQIFAALPKHPAIVPFQDIDTAAGSHYLSWPYVEGESFARLVRRCGPLYSDHVVSFLIDVVDGLALCHQKGIIHGLLKPTNLLLGPDRKAHILDFGIGAILTENMADDESLLDTISTANTAMSMMDFAAPETLANPTNRTAAGDMYSLGCVLYFLLTGVAPFPDGNAVDKIIAHQMQEPVPLRERQPDVPVALADLVVQLMQKNPNDRPEKMEKVRDLLTSLLPQEEAPAMTLPKNVVELWASRLLKGSVSGNPESVPTWNEESTTPPAEFAPLPPPTEEDSVNFDVPRLEATSDAMPVPKMLEAESPPAPLPAPAHVTRTPDTPLPGLPNNPNDNAKRRKSTIQVTEPPRPVAWQETLLPSSHPVSELTNSPARLKNSFVKRFLQSICFWRVHRDQVQFSIFGPKSLAPGQMNRIQVYAHPPASFQSVCTLSRAFQPDTDLLATGFAEVTIPRNRELGLHLAVANAGIAKSLVRFQWTGQARPRSFEVYVPWESPPGHTPAVLSLGLDNDQIGEIVFEVVVLPRQG